MNKRRCEECKHSYQFGNPLWDNSGLRCKKHHEISWIGLARVVNGKECKDYEVK